MLCVFRANGKFDGTAYQTNEQRFHDHHNQYGETCVWLESIPEEGTDLQDVTQSSAEIDATRQAAYQLEVDPLVIEAMVKQQLGQTEDAAQLLTTAAAKRVEIQTRYPKG